MHLKVHRAFAFALILVFSVPALAVVSKLSQEEILRLVNLAKQGDIKSQNKIRTLAEQGNKGAQALLGDMYDLGQGVPQDYVEAAKWYHKAGNQGDYHSQSVLGLMYIKGTGVPVDYIQAYMWANLGAMGGDETSVRFRDDLQKNLTVEQVTEGQHLAREWEQQHPQ